MLKQLQITNYVIIDTLEINFSAGMNIVTGETGAGKSIILGALNLILGERADTSVLVDKQKKCVIEGIFAANDIADIQQFLQKNELDVLEEITVRREITTNGKSRAFINDTPVNLLQLQQLSAMLVDLHQQFDALELGNSDFQINVLDALAKNKKQVSEYQKVFAQWQQHNKELLQLKQQQAAFEKESDYNQFQYEELAEANFTENELEEIAITLKMLTNAEAIKSAVDGAYNVLQEGEQPLVQQLKSMLHTLEGFNEFHKDLPELIARMKSAQLELGDIAEELNSINQDINYDTEKVEAYNERLSTGYKLQKKHGVQSTAALLKIQDELQGKLQSVLHIQEDIEKMEQATIELRATTMNLAETISQAREKQLKPFEQKVNQLLHQVGMPNAIIKVSIEKKEPGVQGIDAVEFLFDANKSGNLKPVSRVASGGELSRLMLCIKSLVARSMDLPTLIFDEIDTGISGEAAKQVGIIMKDLSLNRQVICITHQPQIAGKADAHFFVYKDASDSSVRTGIRLLNKEERITTIAKMLGGEQPTAAALENAREMIQQ